MFRRSSSKPVQEKRGGKNQRSYFLNLSEAADVRTVSGLWVLFCLIFSSCSVWQMNTQLQQIDATCKYWQCGKTDLHMNWMDEWMRIYSYRKFSFYLIQTEFFKPLLLGGCGAVVGKLTFDQKVTGSIPCHVHMSWRLWEKKPNWIASRCSICGLSFIPSD